MFRGYLPTLVVVAAMLSAGALAGCGERDAPTPPAPATDTGKVALETWKAFYVPKDDRIPEESLSTPGTPWGDWVGSEACAPCHQEEYGKWRRSYHSRTLYDAAPGAVFADFSSSAVFEDPKFAFRVEPHTRRDASGRARPAMRIAWSGPGARAIADTYGDGVPSDPEGDFEVLYAFGNRRHQPFVARWPDGRHWVLPVQWDDVHGKWDYSGFRPYVQSCAACHVTGIEGRPEPWTNGQKPLSGTTPPLYAPPPAEERWSEGGVGCEACHGPGRAHVEAVAAEGIEAYRARLLSGERAPTIFDGKAGVEESTWSCDRCHDFDTESAIAYLPGPKGFARAPWKRPITLGGVGPNQFYLDGSAKSPCTVGTVYRGSKMFHEGIRCTQCHDPHGNEHWADLVLPVSDNALCLSCHEQDFPTLADQTRHSRHAAGSPGNLCVECHMPRHLAFSDGIHMLSDKLMKHDFSVPTGVRALGGPPPSCNVCHVDRDDAWTRAVLDAWKTGKTAPK
jgi:predicted CXXCH cytochrome family protein